MSTTQSVSFQTIEIAARQLCILRKEDPDAIDSFSSEPAWKITSLEIERFLLIQAAIKSAGIQL